MNMSDALVPAEAFRSDDFTFLTRREYFRELIERVAKTVKGNRVLIVTHDFHPDEPLVAGLMEMLSLAAARGVHTHFAIDERSFPLMQRVPLNKRSQQLIKSTHETLGHLQAAGVK